MGSTYSLVLYGEDRAKLEAAAEEALKKSGGWTGCCPIILPESEWSEVNRHAAERPVKVSAELFGLLSTCVEYSRQSEGAFDITVGPLMKVWGFYKGRDICRRKLRSWRADEGRLPEHPAGSRAEETVRFARREWSWIPAASEKATRWTDGGCPAARTASTPRWFRRRAAASMRWERRRRSPGWKVRIRDPKNEAKTVTEVTLKNESMSTSGNYEKFFLAEGRMYSHIMDPADRLSGERECCRYR